MGQLYTRLYQNILDVFNEYGVQIMTPAYEGDPEQPKIVPKDQWYAAPASAPAPGRRPSPSQFQRNRGMRVICPRNIPRVTTACLPS